MNLIREYQKRFAFFEKILTICDLYLHLAVSYYDELEALMKMQGEIIVFALFKFKIVGRAEMLVFIKHKITKKSNSVLLLYCFSREMSICLYYIEYMK